MEISESIKSIAALAVSGGISGALLGLAYGYVFKTGALQTAKMLAIFLTATNALNKIVILLTPEEYQTKVYSMMFGANASLLAVGARHYGVIATKGTYFFTAFAILCFVHTILLCFDGNLDWNFRKQMQTMGY